MEKPEYLGRLIIDLYQQPGMIETVHGMITKSREGDIYKILLNGNDDEAHKFATFLHEAAHIYRRDLEKPGKTAAEIETETREQLRAAAAILLQEGTQ